MTKLQEQQLKQVFGNDILKNNEDMISGLFIIDNFFEKMIFKHPKKVSLKAYRSLFFLDFFG